MKAIYQHFIGTTAEWQNENPLLYEAVIGIEITGGGKRLLKIGDGVSRWNDLPHFNAENIAGLPEALALLAAADEQLAPLESPAFTGAPTVPYPGAESNDGRAASTRWVTDRITAAITGELPVPVEQGGTGAVTAAGARANLGAASPADVAAEAEAREAADAALDIKIQSVQGQGGYLAAHDFGAADLSDDAGQEALTQYALSQISGITDPNEIWNGTRVKNLYVDPSTIDDDHPDGVPDGRVWVLNNTPETAPPIFEWTDDGPETIGTATNDRFGVVKGVEDPGDGSKDGEVAVTGGTMRTIGWERRLPPGMIVPSALNDAHLVLYRMLPLDGSRIDLSDQYKDMGDAVWVGAALNGTAEAFYRCDQDGTRDEDGAYMQLPDCRGMFVQGSGSQTRDVNWMDTGGTEHSASTVYDGGAIGKRSTDRMRNITGGVADYDGAFEFLSGCLFAASQTGARISGTISGSYNTTIGLDASRVVPTGPYNAPASISFRICITY
jgi:hypothetical protein